MPTSGFQHYSHSNSPVNTVAYLESVIPMNRLNFLEKTCRDVLKRLPGNVLEVGVYRGGSLIRLAEAVRDLCPEYRVIGIDTFMGHPYSDGHPVHPTGKYSDVDPEILKSLIAERGLSQWITLVQGRVEDIFDSLSLSDISFAHIDCDLYKPISYSARKVPLVLKKSGIIYFDDYGHEHCPGATRAVLENFERKSIEDVYLPEDGTCWSGYLAPELY